MPDIKDMTTPPQRTGNSTCSLVTPELALSTPPLRTSTPTFRPPCELSSRQYSHRHHVNSAGPGGSSTRPCCSLLQPVASLLLPVTARGSELHARPGGSCTRRDPAYPVRARWGGVGVRLDPPPARSDRRNRLTRKPVSEGSPPAWTSRRRFPPVRLLVCWAPAAAAWPHWA